MATQIQQLPKSEVEIEGEIASQAFEAFRAQAVKNLAETVDLEGFRKGHVPENVLAAKIGEMGILEEMAELALSEHYPKILSEHSLDAIGRPHITLTKLARGNPLGWKIRTAVFPKIMLPNYEKIAQSIREQNNKRPEVLDEEVAGAIEKIRELRAGKTPNAPGSVESSDDEKKVLPPLDDAFAQSVGDFKTLEDLRARVRENILKEKEHRAKSKKRAEILDGIVAKTEGEIPDILTESELHTMFEQFKTDIAAMGVTFDEYLKHAKKTGEEVRKEMLPDAEKRVKTNLVLKAIAKEKNLAPEKEAVEKETAHLLEHYKDADPERTRSYVESVLTNEKVMEFLEGSGTMGSMANSLR